jgi:hypothetical protein
MLARVTVANGVLCGSGIAATEAWLPGALDDARPQVVVLAVTPWSLRDDPEPPEEHPLDARWPRAEKYLLRAMRVSAVADHVTRFGLRELSSTIGWPPPAPVLWELTPLVRPRRRSTRWRGLDAPLAHMVALAPARRDADRSLRPSTSGERRARKSSIAAACSRIRRTASSIATTRATIATCTGSRNERLGCG